MGRYILDFFSGKVSLEKTFIYGMIVALVVSFSLFIMSNSISKALISIPSKDYVTYAFLAIIGVITIFLVLSIYRSSLGVKAKMRYLSFAFIVTIVFMMSSSTSRVIQATYNPNNIFESGILSLNKQLPMMIDNETRLEEVAIKDGNIYYNYTLINISSKKINQDFITLAMTDKVYQYGDVDKLILKLSNKKREIHYVFRDKDNILISNIKLF